MPSSALFMETYVRAVMENYAKKDGNADAEDLMESRVNTDAVLNSKLLNKTMILDNPLAMSDLHQRRSVNVAIKRKELALCKEHRLRQACKRVDGGGRRAPNVGTNVGKRVRRHRAKPMTSTERKQCGLYDIRADFPSPVGVAQETAPGGNQRPPTTLSDLLPLHQLWVQYAGGVAWDCLSPQDQNRVNVAVNDLRLGRPGTGPTPATLFRSVIRHNLLEQRLLKADLHGCIIGVVRSRFPGFVGLAKVCGMQVEQQA